MRHRVEQRRPAVERLEADDVVGAVYDDVGDLSRGERFQVPLLLLDAPDAIDRGVHTLTDHDGQDGDDPGSVLRNGAPDLQVRFNWRGQHGVIQA